MRRVVIRLHRRPALIMRQFGIRVVPQHRLGEGAIGLRQPDDPGSRRIGDAVGGEFCGRFLHLHRGEIEDLQHLGRRHRVPLGLRHQIGCRALFFGHRIHADGMETPQPHFTVPCGIAEAGHDGGIVVVDDIPETPASALPGHRVVPDPLERVRAPCNG